MDLTTFITEVSKVQNLNKVKLTYELFMEAGLVEEEMGTKIDQETGELSNERTIRKQIDNRYKKFLKLTLLINERKEQHEDWVKKFFSDNIIYKKSTYKSIFLSESPQLNDDQIIELITKKFYEIVKNEALVFENKKRKKCSPPKHHKSIDEIENYLKECEKNSNPEVKFLIQFSLPYIAFYCKEYHEYEIKPSWIKSFLIENSLELFGLTNPYKETDLHYMILNNIRHNYIQPILQNLPKEITNESILKLTELKLLNYNEHKNFIFSNTTYQNYFAAKHIRNCIRVAMATESFAAEFLFSSTILMKDALYALPQLLWSDDVCEMLGKIQSLPDRDGEKTQSCLHDAFNLLRINKKWPEPPDNNIQPNLFTSISSKFVPVDEYNMFLQNLLNTLRITYQGCITDFDFRDINFDHVSLDCIKFSKDGKNPCKFYGCQINTHNFNKITNMVFSPDEKYLLIGLNGGYCRLINRETHEIVHDYTIHTYFSKNIKTCNLKFSPKGNYFAVSTDILTIWNINKPDSPILSVPSENIPFEFSPNEDKFLYYKDEQFYCLFLKTNKTVDLSFSLSRNITPISFLFHEDCKHIRILFKDTYKKLLYLFKLEEDNLQHQLLITTAETHNLLEYHFEKQGEQIIPSCTEISYPSSFDTKKHLFSPNHKYCLFISNNDIVLKNSKTDQEIYRFKEDNEEIRKFNDTFETSTNKFAFSSNEQYIMIIKNYYAELYHITNDTVKQLSLYNITNDKVELMPLSNYSAITYSQVNNCFYVSAELELYGISIINNIVTIEKIPILFTQNTMKNCVFQTQSEPIQHLLQQFGAIIQSI